MGNSMLEIKVRVPRRLAGLLLAGTALLGLALILAADPGSKDDPLATLSYVQRYAQFTRQELPSGASLRLGIGAELVPADVLQGPLAVRGLDNLRDDLLDLTTGERCGTAQLLPGHHYINAGTHEVFLNFETPAAMLLRGEWK